MPATKATRVTVSMTCIGSIHCMPRSPETISPEPSAIPKPAHEPKGEPVKLKIDLMRVTNAKVHVVYLGQPINISLPEIELKNLDDGHGNAIPPDQILGRLLANITGSIGTQLAGLGKGGAEVVTKGAQEVGAAGKQVGKGIEKAGEKAAGAIKGLFGK